MKISYEKYNIMRRIGKRLAALPFIHARMHDYL